jgi:hypothetical protein
VKVSMVEGKRQKILLFDKRKEKQVQVDEWNFSSTTDPKRMSLSTAHVITT